VRGQARRPARRRRPARGAPDHAAARSPVLGRSTSRSSSPVVARGPAPLITGSGTVEGGSRPARPDEALADTPGRAGSPREAVPSPVIGQSKRVASGGETRGERRQGNRRPDTGGRFPALRFLSSWPWLRRGWALSGLPPAEIEYPFLTPPGWRPRILLSKKESLFRQAEFPAWLVGVSRKGPFRSRRYRTAKLSPRTASVLAERSTDGSTDRTCPSDLTGTATILPGTSIGWSRSVVTNGGAGKQAAREGTGDNAGASRSPELAVRRFWPKPYGYAPGAILR
jgi:hypothetical protein